MQSAHPDKVYVYQQKKWPGPFVVLFFGTCAALFLHKGLNDLQRVIINHVIELSPQGARVFYLILFALAGLLIIFNSLQKPRLITLTADTLTVPKNTISPRTVTLAYREISGLKTHKINDQQFLQIRFPAGKRVIQQAMLPKKDDFPELLALLVERSEASSRWLPYRP